MGKIHIFINIFIYNNNYYYCYLLKSINNLLYDTYDMISYVHIYYWEHLLQSLLWNNCEIIVLNV